MDEFDAVINLLSMPRLLDCECGWEGVEAQTDDGDCPDCGLQVCIPGDD